MTRNRRAGVEDRWTKTVRDEHGNTKTVPSANDGRGSRLRARYVDDRGREHAKAFSRKLDAQRWLDGQTSALVTGTHVAPRDAALTVSDWCDQWLAGYAVNRASSVRTVGFHVAAIKAAFGEMPLTALRPLAASVQRYPSEWMVTDGAGESCPPRAIERAVARARAKVADLPAGFTFHDLRHYLASLLIASGADIKTVQARLRHASASTTLDTYGHLWPDADESTRAAVGAAIRTRIGTAADVLRTN
jgi:integrase